jgi:hypothetical protein
VLKVLYFRAIFYTFLQIAQYTRHSGASTSTLPIPRPTLHQRAFVITNGRWSPVVITNSTVAVLGTVAGNSCGEQLRGTVAGNSCGEHYQGAQVVFRHSGNVEVFLGFRAKFSLYFSLRSNITTTSKSTGCDIDCK